MTNRDTTMLERLALAVVEYSGLARGDADLTLPRGIARAILNELKQVDEGMAEAGFPQWAESEAASDEELGRAAARVFTAMIDHVLSEGEG